MKTIITSRVYQAGNVLVSLTLWEVVGGSRNHTYEIRETFRGSRGKNELLRGIYNEEGVARVDFKNMLNNIERTIPIAQMA